MGISVCMIVKNEEENIECCLESIKEIADEIIIVDTGSTDQTVRLAQQYTDKIFSHPWEDNFSKARNQSIKYATGDWIFIIDADEELLTENTHLLLQAVQNEEIDAIQIQVISEFQQERSESILNQTRLFRNNDNIYFEGRVHNRLVGFNNPKIYPLRIKHKGYDLTPSQLKTKFQRTVYLLKKDLQHNPNNPLPYHYLSCSYLSMEMYQEALDASLTAIRLADADCKPDSIFLWTRFNAARAYYQVGELEKAEKLALQTLYLYPDHIDSHFILIRIDYDQSRWSSLTCHCKRYLNLISLYKKHPENFGTIVVSTINEIWNIYVLLGISNYERGNKKQANSSFKLAASTAPKPFMAWRVAGIYCHERKYFDDAHFFLERALANNPEDQMTKNLLHKISKMSEKEKAVPTISCCMIVKNEEAFLEKCLNSIKDFVDEIVIVDTGSTDNTVKICEQYTDKIFFHPWENSFSEARNQSISYATCDWIFIIDADEELVDGCGPMIRLTVNKSTDIDAFLVNTISSYDKGRKKARHNSERLFRNNGVIHYEGIVHNRVVGPVLIKSSKIEIMHYGYDLEEKKAYEKFIRTTDLLKKDIAGNPDDPMSHHYLGTSYLSQGMKEEALKESLLAIELANEQNNYSPLYLSSHHHAAISYYLLGDLGNAEFYSQEAIKRYPDHLDSYYTLTLISGEKNQWDNVTLYGDKFLKLVNYLENNPDQSDIVIHTTLKNTPDIHLLLGHAAYHFQDFTSMEKHYQLALKISDIKWQVLRNIASFHLDHFSNIQTAERFLQMALTEKPDEPSIWYEFAKLHHKMGNPAEEKTCLEKLYRLGHRDTVVLNRLAELSLGIREFNLALSASNAALECDPSNYQAFCHIGIACKEESLFEKAIEAFMKSIGINDHFADSWFNLAETCIALNRFDDARTFFNQVISLSSPLSIEALIYQCEIELRCNQMDAFLAGYSNLLNHLKLESGRELGSFEDLAAVLLHIAYEVRENRKAANRLIQILLLLPISNQKLSQNIFILETDNREKEEFISKALKKIVYEQSSVDQSA